MLANISEARGFGSKIFEEYHCLIFKHQAFDLEGTTVLVRSFLQFSFTSLSFFYLSNCFDRLPFHADFFKDFGS